MLIIQGCNFFFLSLTDSQLRSVCIAAGQRIVEANAVLLLTTVGGAPACKLSRTAVEAR